MEYRPSFLIVLVIVLTACGGPQPAPTDTNTTPPLVMVGNEPIRTLVDRLAGELVRCELPVPAGEDPSHWRPDDAVLDRYAEADLILLHGAGNEPWLLQVSLPADRLVDTTAASADRLLVLHSQRHSHGPDGEHDHGEVAVTTWLDPKLYAAQLQVVSDELCRLLPDHVEAIRNRASAIQTELDTLHQRLLDLSGQLIGTQLLTSHPVYQYLGRAYGIEFIDLHWEPDMVLDDAALKDLEDHRGRAQAILWEDTPLPASVATLKAKDIDSIVFPPRAGPSADGDTITALQTGITNLAAWVADE